MSLSDVVSLLGVVLVVVGIWMREPWVALVVGGAMLVVLGVMMAYRRVGRRTFQSQPSAKLKGES